MPQSEVEDTNAVPTEATATVEDAQEPSLDSLLADYEEQTEEPTQETPQAAPILPDGQTFMAHPIIK